MRKTLLGGPHHQVSFVQCVIASDDQNRYLILLCQHNVRTLYRLVTVFCKWRRNLLSGHEYPPTWTNEHSQGQRP
jgi:hypothetical protein